MQFGICNQSWFMYFAKLKMKMERRKGVLRGWIGTMYMALEIVVCLWKGKGIDSMF
jgi:hypothetical protein